MIKKDTKFLDEYFNDFKKIISFNKNFLHRLLKFKFFGQNNDAPLKSKKTERS